MEPERGRLVKEDETSMDSRLVQGPESQKVETMVLYYTDGENLKVMCLGESKCPRKRSVPTSLQQ